VTPPFRTLADGRRKALGLAELPVVFVPHPMMTRTQDEIEELADQVLSDVVRVLLKGP